MAPPRHRQVGRSRAALWRTALLVALAAIVLLAALLVVGALHARAQARALQDDLHRAAELAGERLEAGADRSTTPSDAALKEVLTDAVTHAGGAHQAVSGPQWWLAAHVPWLGTQVRALRDLTSAVSTLVTDIAPAATGLVDAAPTLATVDDGQVRVDGFATARPYLSTTATAVHTASSAVRAIGPTGLVGPLARTRAELLALLDPVQSALDLALTAADVVPSMLAPQGEREYLVLVQNTAEPRASGGIVGTVAQLSVADGRVSLQSVVAGGDVTTATPVAKLTDAEESLFGPLLASDMRDVGFTPDRSRAAQFAATMWAARTGRAPDGVLIVDPTVLAAVLQVIGPVQAVTPSGTAVTLTADSAEQVLLRQVYIDVPDPDEQDAVFAAAIGTVLDRLFKDGTNLSSLPVALASAVAGGHLTLWSAHEAEQERLAGSLLGGALTGSRETAAGRAPVVGARFNATSATKLGAYLEVSVDVHALACDPDGSRTLQVTVTLTSTVEDPAALPARVAGAGALEGVVATNVLLYAPDGGQVLALSRDGERIGMLAQRHDGLVVAGTTVTVEPGGSTVLRARMTTGPAFDAPTVMAIGPTAVSPAVTVDDRCRAKN